MEIILHTTQTWSFHSSVANFYIQMVLNAAIYWSDLRLHQLETTAEMLPTDF